MESIIRIDDEPAHRIPKSWLSESGLVRRRLELADGRLKQATEQLKNARGEAAREADRQRLLLDEMHHRAKNAIAVVSAIVSQSMQGYSSVEEAQAAVMNRLFALARVQDLLSQNPNHRAKLSDVVRSVVAPFEDRRGPTFIIENSEVMLKSSAITSLSLLVNELCTNAIKHGALSVDGGTISIEIEEEPVAKAVKLKWAERSNLSVHPPARCGFGTRLIKSMAGQLKGDATTNYGPDGLKFELAMPLAALT